MNKQNIIAKILGIIFIILLLILLTPFFIICSIVYLIMYVIPFPIEMLIYKKSYYYNKYKIKYRIRITHEISYKLFNKLYEIDNNIKFYNFEIYKNKEDYNQIIVHNNKIYALYTFDSDIFYNEETNEWEVNIYDYEQDPEGEYIGTDEEKIIVKRLDDVISEFLQKYNVEANEKDVIVVIHTDELGDEYEYACNDPKFLIVKSYKDIIKNIDK